MSKSAAVGILVLGMGLLFLTSCIGLAEQRSSVNLEQALVQLEKLQKEVAQTGKTAAEAKELSVDTTLRAAEFKEIVLAKLGLWRAKMAEGLMTTIEAREIARRAEEQMEINKRLQGDMASLKGDMSTVQGDVAGLKGDMASLKGDMSTVQGDVAGLKGDMASLKGDMSTVQGDVAGLKGDMSTVQGDVAGLKGDVAGLKGDMRTVQGDVAGLQQKVGGLEEDVKDVQTSVSVAKEMAATAKMEADQARREVKQLARQTQEKTDLLFAKLNDLEKRVKALERLVGKKPIKLKPKKLYPVKKIGKLYKVKEGESLWRIAAKKDVYSNPAKWEKIYQANKNKIANPNIIYPGQQLVIPPE